MKNDPSGNYTKKDDFSADSDSLQACDPEVTAVGKWAVDELKKIDDNAKASKKMIIQEAAKQLEGKIPTDKIAMELVKQLCDVVSGYYVRECLDDKYKQQYRRENAKKKKKDLAQQTPLDSEFVGAIEQPKGLLLLQKTGEGSASKSESESAYPSDTNRTAQPNIFQKDPDPRIATYGPSSNNEESFQTYRFSLPYKALQTQMKSVFVRSGAESQVSFYVVIDTKRVELVNAGIGNSVLGTQGAE